MTAAGAAPLAGPAPLEPDEALLELAHEPLRLFATCDRRVRPLRQRVDELEHGVVEHALVGRERLDVPAHQLPQEPLREALRPAAGLALRRDRPEAFGQGATGGELGATRVSVCGATAKLVTKSLEESSDVDLLRGGNACRRRVF